LIEKLAGEGNIAELCFLFSVVRSGYYAWKKRGIGKRRKENAVLKEVYLTEFLLYAILLPQGKNRENSKNYERNF